jgi:hypothetical protein
VAVFLRVGLDGLGTDVYSESHERFEILTFRCLYAGLPKLDAVKYLHRPQLLATALSALMRSAADMRRV